MHEKFRVYASKDRLLPSISSACINLVDFSYPFPPHPLPTGLSVQPYISHFIIPALTDPLVSGTLDLDLVQDLTCLGQYFLSVLQLHRWQHSSTYAREVAWTAKTAIPVVPVPAAYTNHRLPYCESQRIHFPQHADASISI